MTSENDMYCKLFVEYERSRQELAELVAVLTKGTRQGSTITTPVATFDICSNDDFDTTRASAEDGFVYFPFFIDCLPAETRIPEPYMEAVAHLLRSFWTSGMRAVAACDFEDKLPDQSVSRKAKNEP